MSPEEHLATNDMPPDAAPQRGPAPRGAPAGDASSGDPSNTPPSITQCSGGEDWLELSLYLQHCDFSRLKNRLDAARDAAESNEHGPDELEIGGRKFLMLPSAALAGTKQKQVAYRWRLRSEDGWWLLLMNRAEVHPTMPTGIARATSLPLLRIGPTTFLRQLEESLDDLRIEFVREKLSRVDPCADLADVSIGELYEAFVRGHFVCRARYTTDYLTEDTIQGHRLGRRPTGFDLGRGDSRLRVYDKFRKCMTDFEMLLLMQTRCWGGLGCNAIRAEFELRREKLKSLGVDSIRDWWDKRGAITQYLSHQWCRITASEVDSQHTDRAATHQDWLKIQEAFANWSGEPVGDLQPLARLPIRADHLLQQVIGALVSYHARVGTNVDNNETFAHESMVTLLDLIEDRDMAEEVRRRALEMGAVRR